MDYPFRFWGRDPSDWLEGANDGHFYELRFATAPTRADRLAIASAFRTAMKAQKAATAADRDWLWSGAWAILAIGEKKAGTGPAVFGAMDGVLRAIHAAQPLAEVIFWNARADGKHDWDTWTARQAKAPAAGPPWRGLAPMGRYGRARDTSLAPGEADEDFELARVGKKPPKPGKGQPLKLVQVRPGVAGPVYKRAPDAPLKKAPKGELYAARALPDGGVVALTDASLYVFDASGKERARVDAKGARQLAVTPKRIAVTMTPTAQIRAYRVGDEGLELLGEVKGKKAGPLGANGDRIFYCYVASYYEVTGWPQS